jgi:hypothetical protein
VHLACVSASAARGRFLGQARSACLKIGRFGFDKQKEYNMSDGNSHFLMAVGRIDAGHAIEVADEQLRDVISAVNRTGKKGSVTITLEVSPNGESGFAATAKVAAKAPALNFGQSFFYMGRDGDLTRNAPAYIQESMLKGEKQDG